ncbi:hypothetical protein [Halegenticoccus tardaugens]|uniref:hypothetical protein n=1 Tax=Halegenticoccus tardaugens TaxID=2071624 RepID=UPI00100BF9BC|nr:hypothetical protein [Halegenticoccus tardaugens]
MIPRVPFADRIPFEPSLDAEDLGEFPLRGIFGDRTGLAIFLASVTLVGLYWRIGFFSNDNYALVNGLGALSEGHVAIERIAHGPSSGATPGTVTANGNVYARSYGLLAAAVPFVWTLRAVSLVAEPALVLAGGWCVCVLGLVAILGTRIGRGRETLALGSVLSLALFVASVPLARPLSPRWFPLVAIQIVGVVAAALTAVFVYRLLFRLHGERVGIAAGCGSILATPVGFWASLPKRHSLMALLTVLVLYSFYRSREAERERTGTTFRALSYVWIGLTAWVLSANALVLLVVLLPIDLLTARANRPRQLAVVAGAFWLSLVPFFVTNALIAGNPFEPPRMLPRYEGGLLPPDASGGTDSAPVDHGGSPGGEGSGGSGGESGSSDRSGGENGVGLRGGVAALSGFVAAFFDRLGAVVDAAALAVGQLVGPLSEGWRILLDEPGRVGQVLVRSGYVDGLDPDNDAPVNLSVVESMPLFGALAATPAVLWRRARAGADDGCVRGWRERGWTGRAARRPERPTDAFAIATVALLVLFYLPRLPLHHMLTVRYLHPVYPLGLYLVARLRPVRRVVDGEWALLSRSYVVAVAVGTVGYAWALAALNAVQGEAVQLYALWALAMAGLLGAWALAAERSDGFDRTGALVLGITAAATTTYLLVSGLTFFAPTDRFLLPLSRVVSEALSPVAW